LIKLKFLVIVLILQNLSVLGCVRQKVLYSRPQIDSNIEWRWHEACGYRCKPMVDFFEGHGISIRIESFNYSQTFTIFSFFICEKGKSVTINPEKVFVKLNDGTEIHAKGLTPGFSKEEVATLRKTGMNFLDLLRSSKPLTGDLLLDMPYGTEERLYRPISFFFDVTPPHPSEEFELHIEGLVKNGQKVDVPVIKFGPAIRDSGQGIPIDG
jgi:hypothetical protein